MRAMHTYFFARMRWACPRHHRHHSVDNSQFLQQQEEMKKKGIEEALDKAKLTLSNMMEETEEELDKAIITCKAFAANLLARGGGSAKIRI